MDHGHNQLGQKAQISMGFGSSKQPDFNEAAQVVHHILVISFRDQKAIGS